MTIIHTNNGLGEIHFNSAQEFAEFHKTHDAPHLQGDVKKKLLKKYVTNNYDLHSDWHGYTNGALALKRLQERTTVKGLSEHVNAGAKDLAMFNITDMSLQIENSLFNDESGIALDSNAYFNGDEYSMINYDAAPQTKPIINIACNFGALSSTKSIQFENRGISLLRCVRALERTGVSVGLVAYSKAQHDCSKRKTLQTIVVKRPEQDVDESTLINIFAHQGAFRTLCFANREFLHPVQDVGATMDVSRKDFEKSYARNTTLVILPYSQQSMNKYRHIDDATQWTREQIIEQTAIKF